MKTKEEIINRVEEIFNEIRDIRRNLHAHPELSFEEVETSKYIRSLLDQWGVPYEFPFVKTGILAYIEGEKAEGPVIAIRSDMDALPIIEKTGLPYASVNKGVMHACGHDIHMACLLGTIKMLRELSSEISGKVLFIFQPGEEKLPGGAKLMMEENLFKNHKPDMILAQHVLPEMPSGMTGFRPGTYMASSDEIFITVKGQGGHGALPEKINDPLLMASHILIALQQEVNRKSPKGTPTVLSFGRFIADGAVNVIPDEVKLAGTFRTMNEEWRKSAHELIKNISEGIAESMGGKVDLLIKHGYPVLNNNPEITSKARKLAADLLGEDKIVDMDIRMTAEDFAWFSHNYPSMMYRLGVRSAEESDITPLHTSRFQPEEGSIKTGVSVMTWLAINLLEQR